MDNLIYLYAIIPREERGAFPLMGFKGLDEQHDIYTIPFHEVEAVVCNLDKAEYGEEELEKKTNDAEWLHKKAFHHHEALMLLYQNGPIIPMKFCTIYSSMDTLEDTIDKHKQRMVELLDVIRDKEEWILKIYCDQEKVKDSVAEQNDTVDAKKKEIENLPPGRKYLEKRKLSQIIDQEADKEKQRFSTRIHDELRSFSIETEVKKNWNKDVTTKDEMCHNSVYFLEKDNVNDFLAHVKEMQNRWEVSGWNLEVTGPWPSYHFATIS